MLTRDRYLDALAAEGPRLRAAAARDLDAAVPSCPGWTARDLVRHVAEVYEHKIASVELGGPKPHPWPPDWPPDRDPLEWYDDALARILAVLRTTDPAAPSWTWWPPDQSAGFWCRRMAQEAAVHRVDAELAFGPPSPVEADLAVDGIDELLDLFLAGDWTGDEEPTLVGSVAVETGTRRWLVRMAPDRVDVDADSSAVSTADAEATVASDPSGLLLWLYGRAPEDMIAISGDATAVARLRARIARATQ